MHLFNWKAAVAAIARGRAGSTRLGSDRKGNVLAMTALSLPVLVGAMGLGVDYTQWVMWKRTLQGGADAAALAGARSRAMSATTDQVEAEATKILDTNADVTRSFTDINFLLSPGQGAGAFPTSVEVIAEATGSMHFAGLFMDSGPTIRARAVAGPRAFGQHCLMALHPTANQAINISGNAEVDLTCGVASNSTSTSSTYVQGSGILTATHVSTPGGITVNGGNAELNVPTSNQETGALPQIDPFGPMGRNIQEPTCSGTPGVMATSGSVSPGCFRIPAGSGGNPGTFAVAGNMTLSSGVYVFQGPGKFQINSNHTITGSGVSIVLTDGAYIEISGNPILNLSPMTTPQAQSQTDAARQGLAGVLFWQTDPSSQDNVITGNSNLTLAGALYAPHSRITLTGSMSTTTNCLQVVASTVTVTGDARIPNTCNDPNWGSFGTMRIVLAE